MLIDWQQTHAAIWRAKRQHLKPVHDIDPIALEQLLGIDEHKQQLLANTQRFMDGKPANHALLWGARGTGKSSLVKAVFNQFRDQGLRLIEIDKPDLDDLPDIIDQLRDEPQRFIVFSDDLSFEAHETGYKSLKKAIEGSIELPPANVLFYVTSNRRHLMPESMRDNLQTQLINDEVHYADAIEEKIALADRFGLRLAFYPLGSDYYLQIVDQALPTFVGNREQLHSMALTYAHQQAAKSGRTARQFIRSVMVD